MITRKKADDDPLVIEVRRLMAELKKACLSATKDSLTDGPPPKDGDR